MKTKTKHPFIGFNLMVLVASLVLMGTFATRSAIGDTLYDTLYITDNADNTVKRFDAITGAFLDADNDPTNNPDAFVRSGSGGLSGPRGVLFDGNLLVVNQNVALKLSGEILRYDGGTGSFLGALIPSSDKNAPFAPQGIVLGPNPKDPQGAPILLVADLLAAGNVSTGRIRSYDINGKFLGDLNAKGFQNKNYHPRGLVYGPDGFLYVALRDLKKDQLGGHVLRFKADLSSFTVFIADDGGVGHLNRPVGLVFGPDHNLYITSFRADPTDKDSIRIYSPSGQFLNKIDLIPDLVDQPRIFAQSILFGPNGCLYVPLQDSTNSVVSRGGVRRYCDVSVGPSFSSDYETLVDFNGSLRAPWFMTFENTNTKTLEYHQ